MKKPLKCRFGRHDWTLIQNGDWYQPVCVKCKKYYHLTWRVES